MLRPKAFFPAVGNVCVDIVRCDDLGTRVAHRFDGFALECVQSGLDSFVAHLIALLGNIDSQLTTVEYQKTKPVYDAYRKARNREKYRAGQEQAIILHEAAARSLKAAGIAKLPNLAALQSEYEALQAQKEALYADYGKLKKKVREYDIIKQNIDSILQADRQPEREKGTERG